MRIVSLLPSATDLVCMLGLRSSLAGRTHECDWPPGISDVPSMTSNAVETGVMTSREIDDAIGGRVHSGSSIYALDTEALREAKPDLILTQELCEVCAVSYRQVADAARMIDADIRVISLEPRTIAGVLENVRLLGSVTGTKERAEEIVLDAAERMEALTARLAGATPVRTVCLEWTDPLYAAGHWVPEQVEMAGGEEQLGTLGEPSRRVAWQDVASAEPEALVLMPCGFGAERALSEVEALRAQPGWSDLPAVRAERVWAVDGSSFFNRPGPRVIRGAEILASILHPSMGLPLDPSEALLVPRL